MDEGPDLRQAGPVGEHVAHGDALFAVLRELGPVLRDGIVVVEEPAVGEHVQRRRHHALRRRKGHRESVGAPGPPLLVAAARPEIHHLAAAVIDADGRAASTAPHLAAKEVGHAPELRLAVPLHQVRSRLQCQLCIRKGVPSFSPER